MKKPGFELPDAADLEPCSPDQMRRAILVGKSVHRDDEVIVYRSEGHLYLRFFKDPVPVRVKERKA